MSRLGPRKDSLVKADVILRWTWDIVYTAKIRYSCILSSNNWGHLSSYRCNLHISFFPIEAQFPKQDLNSVATLASLIHKTAGRSNMPVSYFYLGYDWEGWYQSVP